MRTQRLIAAWLALGVFFTLALPKDGAGQQAYVPFKVQIAGGSTSPSFRSTA
jgi:hypothetical protein